MQGGITHPADGYPADGPSSAACQENQREAQILMDLALHKRIESKMDKRAGSV
jgi:hypothetical protein